jgi:hypothetical protein
VTQAAVATTLSPTVIALISAGSAIGGAAVVGLVTIVTTWFTERSRERRHLAELAFQAAIEQYKSDQGLMLEMAKRQPRETFRQFPLDDYLIAMAKLARVLGRNLSDEELGRALADRQQTLNTAREHYRSIHQSSGEESERRMRRGQDP